MTEPKLAAQLYTVRDFTKTTDDFRTSMAKIADIGYTASRSRASARSRTRRSWRSPTPLD